MAFRYAVASGNWSSPATWDGGVSVPDVSDDVRSNGYTVTVDVSITCVTISNRSETSPAIAAGGTFVLTNGVTVTATHSTNGVPLSGTNNHVVFTSSLGAGSLATIIASCVHVAPAHAGAAAINWTGAGTLHWVGHITGFVSTSASTVVALAGVGCTMNHTGDLFSGASNGLGHGCIRLSAASITVNVTGNVYGGPGGGSTSPFGGAIVLVAGATGAEINVTGSVAGGSHSPAIAAYVASVTGTVSITGTMTGGSVMPAVNTFTAVGLSLRASGPFVSSSAGVFPFAATQFRWNSAPSGTYMDVRTQDLSEVRTLYTADYTTALHMPAEADVREGIVYGPSDELAGTIAVPPAGSVALGVPVDNTTGTAAITQQAIADAVGLLIAAYGS